MLKREQDTNSGITNTNHHFFQTMDKKTLRRQRMGSLERRCLKQCVGGRPLYDGEVGLFLVSSSQDNICESRLHAGNGIFHCKKMHDYHSLDINVFF